MAILNDREQVRRRRKPPNNIYKTPTTRRAILRGGFKLRRKSVKSQIAQQMRKQVTMRAKTLLKMAQAAKAKATSRLQEAVRPKVREGMVLDQTLRGIEQQQRLKAINEALARRTQEEQKTDIEVRTNLDLAGDTIDLPSDSRLQKEDITGAYTQETKEDHAQMILQQMRDTAQKTMESRAQATIRLLVSKSQLEKQALLRQKIQQQIRAQFDAQNLYSQQKELMIMLHFRDMATSVRLTFTDSKEVHTEVIGQFSDAQFQLSGIVNDANNAVKQLTDAITQNVSQYQTLITQQVSVFAQASAIKTELDSTQTEIGRIDSGSSSLRSNLGKITADLATLGGQLSNLNAAKADLQAAISNVPVGDAVALRDALRAQQDRINRQIAAIESSMQTTMRGLTSFSEALKNASTNYNKTIQQKAVDLRAAVQALNQDLGSAFKNLAPAQSRYATAVAVTSGLQTKASNAATDMTTAENNYMAVHETNLPSAELQLEISISNKLSPTKLEFDAAQKSLDAVTGTLDGLAADTALDIAAQTTATNVVNAGYPQKSVAYTTKETEITDTRTMINITLPGMVATAAGRVSQVLIYQMLWNSLAGPSSVAFRAVEATRPHSVAAASAYETALAYVNNLIISIGTKLNSVFLKNTARNQLVIKNQQKSSAALKVVYAYQASYFADMRQAATTAKTNAMTGLATLKTTIATKGADSMKSVAQITGKKNDKGTTNADRKAAQDSLDAVDVGTPSANKVATLATARQASQSIIRGIFVTIPVRLAEGSKYANYLINVVIPARTNLATAQTKLRGLILDQSTASSILPGASVDFTTKKGIYDQKVANKATATIQKNQHIVVLAIAQRELPVVKQLLTIKSVRSAARASATTIRDSLVNAASFLSGQRSASKSAKDQANAAATTANGAGRSKATGVSTAQYGISVKLATKSQTGEYITNASVNIAIQQRREFAAELGMLLDLRTNAFTLYAPFTTSIPTATSELNVANGTLAGARAEQGQINLAADGVTLSGAQTTLGLKQNAKDTASDQVDEHAISIQLLGANKISLRALALVGGTRNAAKAAASAARAAYVGIRDTAKQKRSDARTAAFNNSVKGSDYAMATDTLKDASRAANGIQVATAEKAQINTGQFDATIQDSQSQKDAATTEKNKSQSVVVAAARSDAATGLSSTQKAQADTQSGLTSAINTNSDATAALPAVATSLQGSTSIFGSIAGIFTGKSQSLSQSQTQLAATQSSYVANTGMRGALNAIGISITGRNLSKAAASLRSSFFAGLKGTMSGLRITAANAAKAPSASSLQQSAATSFPVAASAALKAGQKAALQPQIKVAEDARVAADEARVDAAGKKLGANLGTAGSARADAAASLKTTNDSIATTQGVLATSESTRDGATAAIAGINVAAAGTSLSSAATTLNTATDSLATATSDLAANTGGKALAQSARLSLFEAMRTKGVRAAQRASAALASVLHGSRQTDASKLKDAAKVTTSTQATLADTGSIQATQASISQKAGVSAATKDTTAVDQALQESQQLAANATQQKQDSAAEDIKASRDQAAANLADTLEQEASFLETIGDVFDAGVAAKSEQDGINVAAANESLAGASKALLDATAARTDASKALDGANTQMATLQSGRLALFLQNATKSTRDAARAAAAKAAAFFSGIGNTLGIRREDAFKAARQNATTAVQAKVSELQSNVQSILEKTSFKGRLDKDGKGIAEAISIHESIQQMAESGMNYMGAMSEMIDIYNTTIQSMESTGKEVSDMTADMKGRVTLLEGVRDSLAEALKQRDGAKETLDGATRDSTNGGTSLNTHLETREQLATLKDTLEVFVGTLNLRGVTRAQLMGVSQSYASLQQAMRQNKEGAADARRDLALDISQTTDGMRQNYAAAMRIVEALRNKESDRAAVNEALKDAGILLDESLNLAERARLEEELLGNYTKLAQALENAMRAREQLNETNRLINELMDKINDAVKNKEDGRVLEDLLQQLRDAQRVRDTMQMMYDQRMRQLQDARERLNQLLNEIQGLKNLRKALKPTPLPPIGAPFGSIAAGLFGAFLAPFSSGVRPDKAKYDTSKECAAGTAAGTKAGAAAGSVAGKAKGAADAGSEYNRERMRRARSVAESKVQEGEEAPEQDEVYMEYENDEQMGGAPAVNNLANANANANANVNAEEEPEEEEPKEEEAAPDKGIYDYEQECPTDEEIKQQYALELNALKPPAVPGATPEFTQCYNEAYKKAYSDAFLKMYCTGWDSVKTSADYTDLAPEDEADAAANTGAAAMEEDMGAIPELEDAANNANNADAATRVNQKAGGKMIYWPRDPIVIPTF